MWKKETDDKLIVEKMFVERTAQVYNLYTVYNFVAANNHLFLWKLIHSNPHGTGGRACTHTRICTLIHSRIPFMYSKKKNPHSRL